MQVSPRVGMFVAAWCCLGWVVPVCFGAEEETAKQSSPVKWVEEPTTKAPKKAKPPVIQVADRSQPNAAAERFGRRSLSIREARELGVTLASVRSCVQELREQGEIDETTSRAEIAALVTDRLMEKNQEAFAASAGLDWEAILAFIERLLPLILRLLGS